MARNNIIQNHLELIQRKMSKVPDDAPNKGLWEAALFLWSSFAVVLTDLEETIKGNGKTGILDRMDKFEKKQDEIFKMVTALSLKQDTTPLNRDTFKMYIVNKVLPPLIVAFIMTIVGIFALLAISHWTELDLANLL